MSHLRVVLRWSSGSAVGDDASGPASSASTRRRAVGVGEPEAGVEQRASPCCQVTTSRPCGGDDLAGDALVDAGRRAAPRPGSERRRRSRCARSQALRRRQRAAGSCCGRPGRGPTTRSSQSPAGRGAEVAARRPASAGSAGRRGGHRDQRRQVVLAGAPAPPAAPHRRGRPSQRRATEHERPATGMPSDGSRGRHGCGVDAASPSSTVGGAAQERRDHPAGQLAAGVRRVARQRARARCRRRPARRPGRRARRWPARPPRAAGRGRRAGRSAPARTDIRSATPAQSSRPVSTIVCCTTESAVSRPSIPNAAAAHSQSLSSCGCGAWSVATTSMVPSASAGAQRLDVGGRAQRRVDLVDRVVRRRELVGEQQVVRADLGGDVPALAPWPSG